MVAALSNAARLRAVKSAVTGKSCKASEARVHTQLASVKRGAESEVRVTRVFALSDSCSEKHSPRALTARRV